MQESSTFSSWWFQIVCLFGLETKLPIPWLTPLQSGGLRFSIDSQLSDSTWKRHIVMQSLKFSLIMCYWIYSMQYNVNLMQNSCVSMLINIEINYISLSFPRTTKYCLMLQFRQFLLNVSKWLTVMLVLGFCVNIWISRNAHQTAIWLIICDFIKFYQQKCYAAVSALSIIMAIGKKNFDDIIHRSIHSRQC